MDGAEVARHELEGWSEPTLVEVRKGASPPWGAALAEVLAPGARVSGTPYLLLQRLGAGGMGEVFEAEHVELGIRCALKVLHREHDDRPDLAARMRDEARALARLCHNNLVEVFDLGETPGKRLYFAMPLLSGRDLRRELSRFAIIEARVAAGLVAQALDGLAAAHAAGIVHRDVKLENLFLCDDGRVKILDFGVAKHPGGGRTLPGGSPGTPRTMAPEQCAGRSIDARTDVYASGLVLYELVAGRGPFDDTNGDPIALRYAHLDRAPPPPSRFAPQPIPRAIEAVIMRALAKSPAERFQSAAEMAEALRRAMSDVAEEAAPALEPRGGLAKRHREMPRAHRRSRSIMGQRARSHVLGPVLAVGIFALGLAAGRLLSAPLSERSAPAALGPR